MESVETALRSQYLPHGHGAVVGHQRVAPPRTNTERGLTANLGDPVWHAPKTSTEKKKRLRKDGHAEMAAKPAGLKALLNVSAIFSKARP